MPGWRRNGLLAGVLVAMVTGCGSDDGTIPPEDSEILLGRLAAVEQAIASGDCDLAEAQAAELVTEVNALPADVGVETKESLREGATNVAQLATDPDECEPTGTTGETGVQTEPETTEPETTEDTTTAPETTEDTTTEEPQDRPPPEEDQGPPPSNGGGGGEGPGNATGGIEGRGGEGAGG